MTRKKKPVEPKRFTKQQRERAIIVHLALVDRIVAKLVLRLPAQVDADELKSAGHVGLCEAALSFDKNRNVEFGAYARQRIHGSVIDHLRTLDMRTRRERNLCKTGEMTFFEVQLHEDNPHLEEEVLPAIGPLADALLITALEAQRINGLLDRLMPRERYVIVQLYWHERTSVDIGDDLGVGQARVSQLKKRALEKLRAWLTV